MILTPYSYTQTGSAHDVKNSADRQTFSPSEPCLMATESSSDRVEALN